MSRSAASIVGFLLSLCLHAAVAVWFFYSSSDSAQEQMSEWNEPMLLDLSQFEEVEVTEEVVEEIFEPEVLEQEEPPVEKIEEEPVEQVEEKNKKVVVEVEKESVIEPHPVVVKPKPVTKKPVKKKPVVVKKAVKKKKDNKISANASVPVQTDNTQQRLVELNYKNALSKLIQKNKRYPKKAKRRRHEGRVMVSFVIFPDGRIDQIQVIESSGRSSLDKGAIKTLKKISGQLPFPKDIQRHSWQFELPMEYRLL